MRKGGHAGNQDLAASGLSYKCAQEPRPKATSRGGFHKVLWSIRGM